MGQTGKINIPLFKNKYKKNDKQPEYTFSFQDENGEWVNLVSAWVNMTKNGDKYLSMQLSKDALDLYIQSKDEGPEREDVEEIFEGM